MWSKVLLVLQTRGSRKLKIMNEYNEVLFSVKKMKTFNFVPRCKWVPLEMGLNFVSSLKLF